MPIRGSFSPFPFFVISLKEAKLHNGRVQGSRTEWLDKWGYSPFVLLLLLTVSTSVTLIQALSLAVLACVSSVAPDTSSAIPCPSQSILNTAARTVLEKSKSDYVASLLKTQP